MDNSSAFLRLITYHNAVALPVNTKMTFFIQAIKRWFSTVICHSCFPAAYRHRSVQAKIPEQYKERVNVK